MGYPNPPNLCRFFSSACSRLLKALLFLCIAAIVVGSLHLDHALNKHFPGREGGRHDASVEIRKTKKKKKRVRFSDPISSEMVETFVPEGEGQGQGQDEDEDKHGEFLRIGARDSPFLFCCQRFSIPLLLHSQRSRFIHDWVLQPPKSRLLLSMDAIIRR
jgi:hypothetical protein